MPISALLLDLDGTLVASNEAHARAFSEAFGRYGHDVGVERVLRRIGMGGEFLVPALIGEEAAERDGEGIREAKSEAFARIARAERFAVCPGAAEVLDAARARGLKLALCTAADDADLDLIFASAGFDPRPRLDAVTTTTDVEDAKPEPDVVRRAAEKLGLATAACALVGDTVYDAEAARKAGAPFLAVTTGPWSAGELRQAGALAAYADAGALARDLDHALAAAERVPEP